MSRRALVIWYGCLAAWLLAGLWFVYAAQPFSVLACALMFMMVSEAPRELQRARHSGWLAGYDAGRRYVERQQAEDVRRRRRRQGFT